MTRPADRWLRRRSLLLPLLLVLLLAGCSKENAPAEEVWAPPDIHPIIYPRAIAYAPASDSFYVVDRMARIQQISSSGQFIREWKMPEQQQGRPVGITVGPDGNLYLADTHYHRVVVYSPTGDFVRSFGSHGTGPGQFIYVTDVAFDAAGRIFVSEYGDNDRIQVFGPLGEFLYQFGRFGQGSGEFSRPQSLVIEGNLLYTTDAANSRIAVFTLDGQFVRNLGSVGSGPGQFRFPYGLEQDLDGHLIVSEFGNNRIQKIHRQTGESLGIWGSAGRGPGQLAYPWAAAVDPRGRTVVVDSGNNRLQLIRFAQH